MLIKVKADDVISVLINGQWIDVEPGGFEIDEIHLHEDSTHSIGLGFSLMLPGGFDPDYIVGPLSSITAYRVSTIDR